MKSLIRTTGLLALILVSTNCLSQNYIGDKAEIEKILSNIQAFSADVMKGDVRAIGEAYAEDAKIFPPNKDVTSDRKNIITYWDVSGDITIKHHKLTPLEIKIMGEEAYDYGYYEGVSVDAEGNESSWKGKYVVVWKKVDDDWEIYLDCWNGITE